MIRIGYKQKLFLWFGMVSLFFAAGIVVFEQSREKQYRSAALEEKLNAYADVANKAIESGQTPDSLPALFPSELRITLIDTQGNVLYDNVVKENVAIENHAQRPEILAARNHGYGLEIRRSASNNREYFYYAKSYPARYIRVALPYDVHVKKFLRSDNGFLYVVVVLFIIALLFVNYVTTMFGKSIRQLRDFVLASEKGNLNDVQMIFPNDELGEIGRQVVKNYHDLERNRKKLVRERSKLLQHAHSSEEGICFFTVAREVEFYNGLFMQYLNILIDDTTINPSTLFSDSVFTDVHLFLSDNVDEIYFETTLVKQGRYFSVHINVFEDKSFEITIRDNTRQEKNRLLKQEMTGNIAHELRTPVTSIRGYLETILDCPLDAEKERSFITKAYMQILTLSELISDMSLITKIEEAPDAFGMKSVDVLEITEKVKTDIEIALEGQQMTMSITIPPGTIVKGNENLLYSIFRNLADNAVKYAGKGAHITISRYNADNDYYYFTFSDNGQGIPNDKHLTRLFERFYRISEGRTRETGGSGLGLSIVKNAIAFHKGTISVKNRAGGGLEFLFKLPRR